MTMDFMLVKTFSSNSGFNGNDRIILSAALVMIALSQEPSGFVGPSIVLRVFAGTNSLSAIVKMDHASLPSDPQ